MTFVQHFQLGALLWVTGMCWPGYWLVRLYLFMKERDGDKKTR